MPFISCLVSKVATEWTYLLFYPPFSGLIPPNVLGIGQSYFVDPQTVLPISIPFQWSYIGQQASCLLFPLCQWITNVTIQCGEHRYLLNCKSLHVTNDL